MSALKRLLLSVSLSCLALAGPAAGGAIEGESERLAAKSAARFDLSGRRVPDTSRGFFDELVVQDRPVSTYYNETAKAVWWGENRDGFWDGLRKSAASLVVVPPAMTVVGAKLGAEEGYEVGGPVAGLLGGLVGLVVGAVAGVIGGIVGFFGGGVSPGSFLNPFNRNQAWESY